MFDKIVIAVGVNGGKRPLMPEVERVASIRKLYAEEPRVEVVAFDGLTVDAAARHNARFLLRGVRSAADFEYEKNLADVNRSLSGLETVLLYALPEYGCVSSSVVRELLGFGRDVSALLPPGYEIKKNQKNL